MSPPRRWPLHPQPGPLEALSSWLARLAGLYDMPVKDLLQHNLGLVDAAVPELLDRDPPEPVLVALADRTGVGLDRLRAMTLAGWVPWLCDTLTPSPRQEQEIFDVYVRQNCALFPPKVSTAYQVNHRKPWRGPWISSAAPNRACPVCSTDTDCGEALVWQLPLMTSCGVHGCLLEDRMDIELGRLGLQPLPVTPAPEPAATLDRYTHQALTAGQVGLPGRTVHVGVWFRLLRSLLHELTLPTSILNRENKATIDTVWQTAGLPERAGLNIWRPYEHLPWDTQKNLLHAAAAALQLAADNRIRALGVHGPALAAAPWRPVHEGTRPPPDPVAMAEEAIEHARTDSAAARQMLRMFTYGCRTLARFEDERAFLTRQGIPAEFLPSARELGRFDLL